MVRRFLSFEECHWPEQAPVPSHFSLEFRLDALALDRPEERAAIGGAFATPLGPALVESTREHMLGPFNLQAERFPLVRIDSVQIADVEEDEEGVDLRDGERTPMQWDAGANAGFSQSTPWLPVPESAESTWRAATSRTEKLAL